MGEDERQSAEIDGQTETIHEAAKAMRDDHGPDHERHAMWTALADHLSYMANRHKPDPEPVELMLHVDEDCPTGECEEYGHRVIACSGCWPTWDGTEAHVVFPCAEFRAVLPVALSYLNARRTSHGLPPAADPTQADVGTEGER